MEAWEWWYMLFDPYWLLLKLHLIKSKGAFKNIGVQNYVYLSYFNAFLASLWIHYATILLQ